MQVGFIGLGNMGAFMAKRLIDAGHQLFVNDLNPQAIEQLVAQGATEIKQLNGFAEHHLDAIFTMLPAAEQVKNVYINNGLIASLKKQNCILVDCSTIDPASAQIVAQHAHENHLEMLDAPVSGGTVGAKNGTLTFMVGGNQAALQHIQVLFDSMGKNTIHCGEHGHGQVAKIANNMLLGITMVGAAEAMNLGLRLGMNAQTLAHVINHSSGRSWSTEVNNPVPQVCPDAPASRNYTGGFASQLMLKDLGLALEAAQTADQPVFMGSMAKQMYHHFTQEHEPNLDFSAIIKLYQNDKEETK